MKQNQFYKLLLNWLNIKLFELGINNIILCFNSFAFAIVSRILNFLDNLASNCDINMTVNVSAFSTTTSTYGRVHLISPGYDALCRYVSFFI